VSASTRAPTRPNEVASAVEDISVVLNPEAGFGARVLSAVSLGSEYLPVSIGDIKDGVRWLRGSDRAADAAKAAKGVENSGEVTYQTYTKTNPTIGKVYSGRTHGTGTPEENIRKRESSHHIKDQGYEAAQLDKSSNNGDAIRGREQFLIEQHGGAQKSGGTSGNRINGISPRNRKGPGYKAAAKQEFGE
jgi:hypothetical protein